MAWVADFLYLCRMEQNIDIRLLPLQEADREQFILDNQLAFKYLAMEEFGMRDDRMEEGEELGFHIVEFWNKYQHGPVVPEDIDESWSEDDEMFLFRKTINNS